MPTKLKVLILEDRAADAELALHELRRAGYEPEWKRIETEPEFLAQLDQGWEIILADYNLPEFSGPRALALLRKHDPDLPLIIVSGTIGEDKAVAVMKAGANDYIMKDRLARLGSAVERVLRDAVERRERKRAEEALRSEQRMLARTEGIANIGSWLWDIATDTVTWSNELFRIFQRDPREGAPSFAEHPAFYHPDDMARLRQAVEAAVAHGTPYELKLRAIRKDGETRACMARGAAEPAPGGRTARLYGSLQDITERMRAEEARLQAEENFRRSLDESPLGIRVVSAEGKTLYANRAILDLYGYGNIEELRSIPVKKRYTPESYAEFKSRKKKRMSGEDYPSEYEIGIIAKTGEVRHLQVFRKEILWDGKKQFQAIYQDITERKRAEAKVQETLIGLRKALNGIIQALSAASEKRDPYTAGHQRRVADLARAIAQELKLPPDRVEGIRLAGVIHDIGKLSIPAEILSKPARLSKIEYELIQSHAQIGHDILRDIAFSWPIATMILQHHERMDASGYPQHLKGNDILLESRILAVSDVIEAMASHRPYRPALGIEAALREIENDKGVLYDPAVVSACLALFHEKGYALKE